MSFVVLRNTDILLRLPLPRWHLPRWHFSVLCFARSQSVLLGLAVTHVFFVTLSSSFNCSGGVSHGASSCLGCDHNGATFKLNLPTMHLATAPFAVDAQCLPRYCDSLASEYTARSPERKTEFVSSTEPKEHLEGRCNTHVLTRTQCMAQQPFFLSRSNISVECVFLLDSFSTRMDSSFIIGVSDFLLYERTRHEEHLALCIQWRTPLMLP